MKMTDTQFIELMARLDNLQLMILLGFCFVVLGIGWFIGGQR